MEGKKSAETLGHLNVLLKMVGQTRALAHETVLLNLSKWLWLSDQNNSFYVVRILGKYFCSPVTCEKYQLENVYSSEEPTRSYGMFLFW